MNRLVNRRNSLALALLLAGCSSPPAKKVPDKPAATPAPPKPLASGIDLANFDQTVRPQDDLFRAVNGAWLKRTEIPADRTSTGPSSILAEKSEADVREIVEAAAGEKNAPGSEAQKVAILYTSYMDQARADELGIRPDRLRAGGR